MKTQPDVLTEWAMYQIGKADEADRWSGRYHRDLQDASDQILGGAEAAIGAAHRARMAAEHDRAVAHKRLDLISGVLQNARGIAQQSLREYGMPAAVADRLAIRVGEAIASQTEERLAVIREEDHVLAHRMDRRIRAENSIWARCKRGVGRVWHYATRAIALLIFGAVAIYWVDALMELTR